MELLYGSAIPPLGISEETQTTNLKDYVDLCVHCSIIYNNQDMKQLKGPQ